MNAHASKEPTLKTVTALIEKVHHNFQTEIKDLRETVEFIKDHAVTKDDLAAYATKHDLRELQNTMIDHIDHFVQLHKKQEVEIVALHSRMDRHESSPHS